VPFSRMDNGSVVAVAVITRSRIRIEPRAHLSTPSLSTLTEHNNIVDGASAIEPEIGTNATARISAGALLSG
jgi:hypothetical protein